MAFKFDKLLPPKPDGFKRYSYDAKGLVLRDKNGIVFVPFEQTSYGWYCTTLYDPKGVYPRHGYNILVGNDDIQTADEIEVDFNAPCKTADSDVQVVPEGRENTDT